MSEGAHHAQAVIATIGAVAFVPWLISVVSMFKFNQDFLFPIFFFGTLILIGSVSILLGVNVYWWLS